MKKHIIFTLVFLLVISIVSAASDLSVDEEYIVVISEPEDSEITETFTIENTGTTVLTNIIIDHYIDLSDGDDTIDLDFYPSSISSLSIGESQEITIEIEIDEIEEGIYSGPIVITSNEGVQNSIYLSIIVTSDTSQYDDPVLSATPDSLELQGKEDSQSNTETFIVKNTGGIAWNIIFDETNLELTDGDYTIDLIFDPTYITFLDESDEETISVYADIPNNMDIGLYGGSLNITDGIVSTNLELDIIVTPDLCEEGIIGDLEITDIGLPDDFAPGKTIKIDVEVYNDNENDLDIIVELSLYNIKKGKKIVSVESDEKEISSEDDDTFENIELTIPTDSKYVKEDGEYVLFVKAFEKGDEEENCHQSYEGIDIKLEEEKAVIESVVFSPTTISCGDTVTASIKVRNVGEEELEDVRVEINNFDLDINKVSEFFDLQEYDDEDDNHNTVQMRFEIPEGSANNDYEFLDIKVLYEDESSDVNEILEELPKLTVSGCGITQETSSGSVVSQASLAVTPASTSVAVGSNLILNYVLTNPTNTDASYIVDFVPSGNWANTVSQTVTVNAGQTYTGTLTTRTNSVAQATYTGTLSVKSGSNVLTQKTINMELLNPNQISGGVTYTEKSLIDNLKIGNIPIAFWIIADLILAFIILAMVYIVYRR